jgi:branched-chain amino acid transport system permease protein
MSLPVVIFFGIDLVKFSIDFVQFYALYLAISLTVNLEFGYTGIPNFGKVLYIAAGASVAGSIAGRVAAWYFNIDTHGDFITYSTQVITQVDSHMGSAPFFAVELLLLGLLIAALVGAALGYLSSYPAIRLREDYLGMFLLVTGSFYQIFLRSFDPLVGGTQGIFVPDPYFYFTSTLGLRDLVSALVMAAFALCVFAYAERVGRSPLGRMLKAVRDSEDAAMALGKDVVKSRRNMLIIGSAISGMAGALVTFYSASVGADTWTRFFWTFFPWLIVIIGGAGNNFGTAVGAAVFAALTKGLEQSKPFLQPYVPFDVNWLQYLVLASLLVVIMLVRPQGLIPEKPTPALSKDELSKITSSGGTQSTGGLPRDQTQTLLSRMRSELHNFAARLSHLRFRIAAYLLRKTEAG